MYILGQKSLKCSRFGYKMLNFDPVKLFAGFLEPTNHKKNKMR